MTTKIACCLCGAPTPYNGTAMCATCVASEVDLFEGVAAEVELLQCRSCLRFLSSWASDRQTWLACELESAELLSLCLRNVSGLGKGKGKGLKKASNNLEVVDAAFLWTGESSLRSS